MCLLTVCAPNTIPTREELALGACSNLHGFGYAIIVEGELVVNRSMEASALINEFLAIREKNMTEYAVFHARYASHGSIDIDNCHPFYLGEDKKSIMAHNGNLPNDLQPKDDTRSDTRWFAETVMPSLGGIVVLDNPYFDDMLAQWAGSNRIVFLTVNPEAECQLYLFGEKHGETDTEGVWWSNIFHRNWSNGLISESKASLASQLLAELD